MAPTELLQAYLATRYIVVDNGVGAEATVGVHSVAVDAVLARHGAKSGVFITAWNPRSQPQQRAVNEAAQQRLEDMLRAQAITCLPHLGVGPDLAWESEHGVLALDLNLDRAVEIAEAFGQNALVLVKVGQPARLVRTTLMPVDRKF